MTLRIMDAGGQAYFDFLKPMLMQDRALVLLCVRVGDEEQWEEQLHKYLDLLSTLMKGGVVIPVITQADCLRDEAAERRLMDKWHRNADPVLQLFSDELEIEREPTLVSSRTGQGIQEVVQKLKEGVVKVLSPC